MNESSDDDEEIAAGSEFEEEIDSLNESDHNSDTDQESDDDEEIAAGSEFEEEIDSLNESDHNSDTDQEGDEETAVCQENEYYTGKDNSTKWSKQKPSSTVRTRAHNIIIYYLPGPEAEAKEAKSEIECLNLFVYPDIITALTVSTNTYILHIKQKYSREQDARLTDAGCGIKAQDDTVKNATNGCAQTTAGMYVLLVQKI
ncbi:hypothetical protein QE152_g25207 [Popillia japonica]|uniref:Uncharacterized protein n=1 Tax=Popillia japonica TaxID=7064 RepID=A0AAW1K2U4_POPJA